jgi:hypothetical protein
LVSDTFYKSLHLVSDTKYNLKNQAVVLHRLNGRTTAFFARAVS